MKKSVMKKEQKKNNTWIIIGIIILIIVIIGVIALNKKDSSYSPDGGINENAAEGVLNALGPNGIAWYCGEIAEIRDAQGNVYGAKEREQLRNLLGNVKSLCGK